jgi:Tat protein translocase TatB subunit
MIGIGPIEILVILIVTLVVIGPEKMPELARALARIMRDLRVAMDEVRTQFEEITREDLLDTKEIESYYHDTIDSIKESVEPPAELEQATEEAIDSLTLIEGREEPEKPQEAAEEQKKEPPPEESPS